MKFGLTQEIESAEEKLRAELERLQYVVAERDRAAYSAAAGEKKELQADGQRSDFSSIQDFSTLEEQGLQSIKVELVRFETCVYHRQHRYSAGSLLRDCTIYFVRMLCFSLLLWQMIRFFFCEHLRSPEVSW